MNPAETKKHFAFIEYLYFFAALLVLNSHLQNIYPNPAFAFGGALGNALFFAASGFTNTAYADKRRPLLSWLPKKLRNIYLPAYIMMIVKLILKKDSIHGFSDLFSRFIWPTSYWFIGAIALFYILYYLLGFVSDRKTISIYLIIAVILYAVYYIFILDTSKWTLQVGGLDSVSGAFNIICYFTIMMIGKWFRLHFHGSIKQLPAWGTGSLIFGYGVYGIENYISAHTDWIHFQFLTQVSLILFTVCALAFAMSAESALEKKSEYTLFRGIVRQIGSITVYLYVTQFFIIGQAERFSFPLSLPVALFGIVFSALLMKFVCRQIISMSDKLLTSMKK